LAAMIAKRLAEEPRAAWVLAAGFALAGVVDVLFDRHLHDEGQLTYLFARMTADAPIDLLFLQKSRPPISLVYAPFAAIGPGVFGVVHVIVAATAIGLLASIARSLGHRWPNLAALVLAASPMYFACAAAGVSNSDGVAVAILGVWLWHVRKRPFAGAIVLSLVPWIRAEVAPLSLLLLVIASRDDRRRAWSGALVFPLVYALVGAIVHRDPLWWAHYPPALPEPMPGHPLWAQQDGRITLASLSATMLALSPVWLLAIPVDAASAGRSRLQWTWLGFAAFELGLLLAMPRWRVFNFDLSPRYLLGVLPAFALVVSSRVEALVEPPRNGTRVVELSVLLGGAAIGFAVAAGGVHPAALAATAGVAIAIVVGRAGRVASAAIVVALLVAIGPLGFGDGTGLRRDRVAPELAEIRTRLEEDPRLHGRPIFTNAPLLASVLPIGPYGRVHYIVQADQLHEIVTLTNPNNGQRERVLAAMSQQMYGIPMLADAFVPGDLPADAVLVLVEDPRLELVMPAQVWSKALVVHSSSERVRIAELRPRKDAPR